MRKFFLAALIAVIVVALIGSPALAEDDELVVAQGATRTTLDPHGENDQPTSQIRSQIYDTLLRMDEEMEIHPGLAEDWEQVDDTTWDFYLREGVEFHNGEELTAHDVKYTFDRMVDPEDPAVAAFILDQVEETEVVDDYTIRLHLEIPFVPILQHLAHPVTGILNETATEELGEDYGTLDAIGTGPYEFDDWATGDYVDLVRNDNYWGENGKVERIRFRAIPEDTVRAIEVETAGVDIAYDISPIDEERLVEDPEVNVFKYAALGTDYIGFNVQEEPYDQVEVRRAINYAVDVDTIIDAVYEGQGVPAAGPISDMVWGAHPDLEPYGHDVERAQELMAEAGYEDGFETTFYTNDNPQRIQTAEIVQDQLAQLNIDVEVNVLDWGDYLERTGAGEHEMFMLGWVSVTGDADYGLYSLFHSEYFGDPGNRTFFAHPELDERLDVGRRNADEDIRLDAYHGAQEIIRDQAPWIFIRHAEDVDAARDYVEGFVPHPAGHHDLSNVTL